MKLSLFLAALLAAAFFTPQAVGQSQPDEALTVFKSPTCGCCSKWLGHLEAAGFTSTARDVTNMSNIKQQYGIPAAQQSCHTAVSPQGYVFEGHVPAKFIRQFLSEKPLNAIGLAVPAMPVGTPGMEMGNRFQPYQVLLLLDDGSTQIYAEVSEAAEQY